jgi:hypothetical protein
VEKPEDLGQVSTFQAAPQVHFQAAPYEHSLSRNQNSTPVISARAAVPPRDQLSVRAVRNARRKQSGEEKSQGDSSFWRVKDVFFARQQSLDSLKSIFFWGQRFKKRP